MCLSHLFLVVNRVAHFLCFQFPVGKQEVLPTSWSGKLGNQENAVDYNFPGKIAEF